MQQAEPIGPNNFLDIMVIAPCTGNSAAKIANGITDTPFSDGVKSTYEKWKTVGNRDFHKRCTGRQF